MSLAKPLFLGFRVVTSKFCKAFHLNERYSSCLFITCLVFVAVTKNFNGLQSIEIKKHIRKLFIHIQVIITINKNFQTRLNSMFK